MSTEEQESEFEEISLSRIIYGAWRWDACEPFQISWGREIIEACLEAEITTFDHADIYGDFRCEEYFGRVLKESSGLRDQIEIISKCGNSISFPQTWCYQQTLQYKLCTYPSIGGKFSQKFWNRLYRFTIDSQA